MILPSNFESIKPQDDIRRRIVPGGYIAQIKGYEDVEANTYIKLYIDIIGGDFDGYFTSEYKRNKDYNAKAKWSNGGTIYRSYSTKALPFFKGMITAIETSNDGYKFNPDDLDGLKNKLVGVIYGEEEYIGQDGQVKISCKPRYVCGVSVIEVGEYKVPECKKLQTEPQPQQDYTDYDDTQLPF